MCGPYILCAFSRPSPPPHPFHCVPHRVNVVVVHIRVARQHLDRCAGSRSYSYSLNSAAVAGQRTGSMTIAASPCSHFMLCRTLPGPFWAARQGRSGGAVVRRRISARRLSADQCAAVRVGQAALHQQLGRLAVGACGSASVRHKSPACAARRHNSTAIVGPGVGVPAPVHAVVHAGRTARSRHPVTGPQLQVLKHRRVPLPTTSPPYSWR